mgnify:CR=1 FL=1
MSATTRWECPLGTGERYPRGATHAAGECPNGVGEAICNRVLYQSRVFVTPGFIFGSEGRNYIRISLCCNEEMLQEALDRITTTRTKQNQ